MRAFALVALIALVAGCADGDAVTTTTTPPSTTTEAPSSGETVTSTSTTTVADAPLPPHRLEDLAALFDPIVEPLGYRVTRGSLIIRSTYAVDPDGDHLALYLRPFDDLSNDEYAADLAPIAEALIPLVFERWPELVSFDVCQEPFGSTEQTAPSLTIVDLDREAASQVDWSGIDLAGLIEAGATIDGLAVWARPGVRDSSTWTDAAGG